MSGAVNDRASGGLTLAWFAAMPIAMAVRGYVAARLWVWFAVPLGAPAIAWWHWCGLLLIGAYAMPSRAPKARATADDLKGDILRWVIMPPSVLAFGWFWHAVGAAG